LIDWAAWGPTLVSLGLAVFVAGSMSQQLKDQGKRIDAHDERLKGHDDDLKDHSDRLARAEAWREGYSAGAHRSAKVGQ
jgi:hypothetical protein